MTSLKGAAVAGLLVIAILVGAGAGYLFGNTSVKIATSVSTSVIVTSTTTTVTAIVLPGTPGCAPLNSSGYDTPIPTEPWFSAGVNYSGPWVAVATVYTGGTATYSACYTGGSTGGSFAQFIYQSPSLTMASTIRIIATKLDGSTGTLQVACNGQSNSTSLPFGSVSLGALVYNA